MKRTIFSLTFLFGLVLSSCNTEPSLQTYFVDHQEAPNFISQDLPISMLDIDKTNFTEKQQEAFESVKRLNFLGYKIKDASNSDYDTEIQQVKTILKQKKYEDLMEFNNNGRKILVKYIGDDDEVDEFILFGSAKDMGFAVVRILGKNMSPEKMVTLAEALRTINVDENQMQEMLNFFQ